MGACKSYGEVHGTKDIKDGLMSNMHIKGAHYARISAKK